MTTTTHASRRLLAVLACLALVLSACARDDGDGGDTAEDEPTSAATAEATIDGEDDAAEDEPADQETADAVEGGEITVGMLTTLSGGAAYLGEDIRDGFQLAFDQDGRYALDLVIEDDAQDPDQASQIADRMISRDEVDIMTGIVFSNVAGAVVPLVLNEGLIYLSPNAGPSTFAGEQCNENYFSVSWQNDDPAQAMGEYVAGQDFGSVVALAPNYQAGQDSIAGFKRGFGEVQEEIYTEFGATDYAQAIAQIRDADPDAVYFFYPGGMGISFVQQYIDSGLDIPVFGPTFSFDETLVDAIGEPALGLRNSSFWAPDLDVPGNSEFVEAFRDAYGHTPTNYAAQGYDTANLLISALDANGGDPSDTEGMREAIAAADFDSVRGDFEFGTNNHPIQDWYLLEVVEGEEEGDLTNTIVETIVEDLVDAYASECSL
ncbi:MAG TPA: ABC transporter substrate-binding protein [Euzebya sp.]|nr:ABC transporter substrate-binding protein [Euzebya sp.]